MPRFWISLLNVRTCSWISAPASVNVLPPNASRISSAPHPQNARSLFLGTFGRKLLHPKKSHTISHDHTSVLYGIGYEPWKDKRERNLWDGDFIEYQNYLQISVLQELLGIPSIKADQIVHKSPIFHYTDPDLIRESFK